jgi:hypothetical protein
MTRNARAQLPTPRGMKATGRREIAIFVLFPATNFASLGHNIDFVCERLLQFVLQNSFSRFSAFPE